jgi:hypothetical protein
MPTCRAGKRRLDERNLFHFLAILQSKWSNCAEGLQFLKCFQRTATAISMTAAPTIAARDERSGG